ncbi:ApaG-like Co2+/Mg2+ efflux protein [Candidatus Trichorickettsia mobilis]|uniref:ApaG-like Co2+/Mg2+ efflux protein n=1 Tax=Candidatus Trichorickettsia mobilis TaxID=1346319 RepID=A0ABZ0UQN8_9RICK|nr:Co2+/Mg2+ efflux protein ApaG [Candidatus Trichorickettsia mobilis]WPY00365.1 ApaG-like Co2+/Mg2+ efflux protein [Candidatus Trichorickettsia mobilis]
MGISANQKQWIFIESTEDVRVSVQPEFYAEGSKIEQNSFVWLYSIRIENLSEIPIQVVGRHWQIFDANGKMEEVKGAGVVGQQPIIKPREVFEYTSQVRLFSSSGLMLGRYFAVNLATEQEFVINVPAFSLDINNDVRKIN